MNNKNEDLTLINEVYRNAKTALLSIDAIYDSIENDNFKSEIDLEREEYSEVLKDILNYMADKGYETVEVSPIKKTGMNIAVKVNTAFDNSVSHLAELMIKGTVMGITELNQLINGKKAYDEDIYRLAKKLLAVEEKHERNLKEFL